MFPFFFQLYMLIYIYHLQRHGILYKKMEQYFQKSNSSQILNRIFEKLRIYALLAVKCFLVDQLKGIDVLRKKIVISEWKSYFCLFLLQ